jgi:hypothetical protein
MAFVLPIFSYCAEHTDTSKSPPDCVVCMNVRCLPGSCAGTVSVEIISVPSGSPGDADALDVNVIARGTIPCDGQQHQVSLPMTVAKALQSTWVVARFQCDAEQRTSGAQYIRVVCSQPQP